MVLLLSRIFFKQIFEAFPIPCLDPHTSSHDLPKSVPVAEVQFSCRFNLFLYVYILGTLNGSLSRRVRDLGVKQMVGIIAEGKERAFNGELKRAE